MFAESEKMLTVDKSQKPLKNQKLSRSRQCSKHHDLLGKIPTNLLSATFTLTAFVITLSITLANPANAFPEHDANFFQRHAHRQAQQHKVTQAGVHDIDPVHIRHFRRRSANSNGGGSIMNEISLDSPTPSDINIATNDVNENMVTTTTNDGTSDSSSGRPHVCASCIDRELYRNITLLEIKKDILKKLGMSQGPPQVSAQDVNEHLVQALVEKYRSKIHSGPRHGGNLHHYRGGEHGHDSHNMQNDDANLGGGRGWDDDNDDSHFQAREINIIAQKRK